MRKFLKYKEGNIEYIKEGEVSKKDIIREKGEELKEKAKKYGMKDYMILTLVLLLIIGPIMYVYVFENNNSSNNVQQGSAKKEDIAKPQEKENNKDTTNPEKITREDIENRLLETRNSNIKKLNSYFDNKSNRAGLKSLLEKNLKKQKDLYYEAETLYETDIELQELILTEVIITSDLIDMISDKITKSRAEEILSTLYKP